MLKKGLHSILICLYLHVANIKLTNETARGGFGNTRSFKDINTLNLSAAKIKSKHESIDRNNVIIGKNIENISFLKSKAIYGANASGKSNIIKALITFSKSLEQSRMIKFYT